LQVQHKRILRTARTGVKAVTGLFIDHDPGAIDKYWSEEPIQHNPMFPSYRDVTKGCASNPPPGFTDEMGAVIMARAIVFEPRVMLMDEPLSTLDKKIREHMQLEIRKLLDDLGSTTIYVTHDQREALSALYQSPSPPLASSAGRLLTA
jgi:hypothetical protein